MKNSAEVNSSASINTYHWAGQRLMTQVFKTVNTRGSGAAEGLHLHHVDCQPKEKCTPECSMPTFFGGQLQVGLLDLLAAISKSTILCC